MKKVIAILVGVLFAFTAASSGSAAIESVGDPGRAWPIPNDGEIGTHSMQFLDTFPGERGTELLPQGLNSRYTDEDPTCSSLNDAKCIGKDLDFGALLPFCATATEIYCTSDFGIIDSSGQKTKASFNRYFPIKAQNQFIGDSDKDLPSGVSGSLFSIPEAPHDGGNLYYLSVLMRGNSYQSRINLTNFTVNLYPVKLETEINCSPDQCNETGWGLVKGGNNGGNPNGKDSWLRQASGASGNKFCVAWAVKENLCAERYAFPSEKRFYLNVKTRLLPSGWMHGRLSEPDIQISTVSGISTIEMQGIPVAVPVVYKAYRYTDLPAELKSQYDVPTGGYIKDPNFIANPTTYVQGGRTSENTNPLLRNVIYSPKASSIEGMEQLNLWLPFVEDKATALLSYWSVRTLEESEMAGTNECFKDSKSVTGIVTTNSTQYSAGPPSFSRADGTLNYQVAAPHFATDKSEFKGSYDLVIRSDVARCIYGFSKAPISATISVTSSDGTPQIATTIIGEKNGWVFLRAKNFGFSTPIIKATLTQEVVVTPTPSASPVIRAKTTTITCSKGKLSKKVIAVKPKCPNGYKKK